MTRAVNDATLQKAGDIYQYLIALRDCFELNDGDTLQIETNGDVSIINDVGGRFQREVKHHFGNTSISDRDAMSRERVLKTYVNEVKKNYDYVLIDCMPSLGMITINALAAADSVIIPTQPHYLSAKGLELLLRSVSMVKRQINPKLRIDGILMTMVMPRTNISKEITATVKSAYGKKIKVFDTEIPHSIRAVEATAEGKSIFAYDKSGKVAAAYEQLGKEVAEIGEKQRNQNRADRIR